MKHRFTIATMLFTSFSYAQNVGIGTTTPTFKLQVNSAGYGIVHSDLSNNVQVGTYVSNVGGWLGTRSNHNLHFFTKNSNPLITLDTLGRFGIGTQAPTYLLDVNGRARLRHNGATSGIWYNKANNTEEVFTGLFNDSTFGFFGNGNWRMGFDVKNSQVGIGIMDPSAPLSFPNTIGNKIALWGDATGGHYGLGIQGSLLQMYSSANNADIAFGYGSSTAFNENMRVKGNGNVGIGTNNPGAKLEVAGTLKIVDGTQGLGKVLTSNANGNASWANAAYGNTERFQFKFRSISANSSPTLSTDYNFGTATASNPDIDRVIININKSGLYHFDLHCDQTATPNYSITSANPLTLNVQYGLDVNEILNGQAPFYKYNNASNSAASFDKSYEVYITAPASFYVSCYKVPSCNVYDVTITGHLIAN